LQNPPLTARYFAFQDTKTNLTQVILYWYENALFNTGSSTEQEHVKISLIAYAKTPEEVPNIEEQLLPFAKAIANYWQPIKTWSQIALLISQNNRTTSNHSIIPGHKKLRQEKIQTKPLQQTRPTRRKTHPESRSSSPQRRRTNRQDNSLTL